MLTTCPALIMWEESETHIIRGEYYVLEYYFFHKWPYCIRAHIHSKKGIDESHDHQFINLFEIVCLIKLELSSKRKH